MADEITDTGSPVTCPESATPAAAPLPARSGPPRLPAAVAARLADQSLEQTTVFRAGRPVDTRRLKANMEVRASTDAEARVVGYASIFDFGYSVYGGPEYGGWTETIAPGAFRKTLTERADVRLLLNHDGIPLARTRSATMRLDDDDVGLFVDADLDLGSSTARDVTVAMRRGDLDEMSFAFEIVADEWSPDFMTRRIHEVRLYDVSLVTYPASGAASAYLAEELADRPADEDEPESEPAPDDDEGQDDEDVLEAASAASRGLSLSQAMAQRDRVLVGR